MYGHQSDYNKEISIKDNQSSDNWDNESFIFQRIEDYEPEDNLSHYDDF